MEEWKVVNTPDNAIGSFANELGRLVAGVKERLAHVVVHWNVFSVQDGCFISLSSVTVTLS